MIYITIFTYLFVLSFYYDVLGYRKNYNFHFVVALSVLILVSGLRYRLGADTAIYMYYYNHYCHDIFHLTQRDFSGGVYEYEPLWVILNSLCKTFTDDFWPVQLMTSIIHISAWSYFVKKVCPNFCFLMLVFFFLFEWFHMDFVLMREAIALGMFLLAVLSLNNKQYIKMVFWVLMAFLFHKFSIMVFLMFFLYYKLLSRHVKVGYGLVVFLMILGLVYEGWVWEVIGRIIGVDSMYSQRLSSYANSEYYGSSQMNWKGRMVLYVSIGFYMLILRLLQDKIAVYIQLNKRIVETAIVLSAIILTIKDSVMIFYRVYDYFHTFTSLLLIVFLVNLANTKYYLKYKIVLFVIFMLFPLRLFYSSYVKASWGGHGDVKRITEFVPYSSVLLPERDDVREKKILNTKKVN